MASPDLTPDAKGRLHEYLDQIGQILNNKCRRASFAMYAFGLFGDGERKSAEPIAARACPDPDEVEAVHYRLLHFLRGSQWEDAPVRGFAAHYAVEAMQAHAPIETWIVDDTGFLKKGDKSPGVQRQYTGSAGKVTNCQIGVSLSLANGHLQVPVDWRLYIPESWANDRKRCAKAHIPSEVGYEPKWRLALDMIESAVAAELPRGVVVADADYGNKTPFRDSLDDLGLVYAVGIHETTNVRVVRGKARRRLGPVQSVLEVAFDLPESGFRRVTWADGTKAKLSSKFAVIRVEVAHGDERQRPEQWLIIEWPDGEHKPTKYALSTMPRSTSRIQLVRTVKERWRTERVYEDLKGQLGLDHYEGRSFVGWHHHVTVALCCYAFVVAEHSRSFSPSAAGARSLGSIPHAA